MKRALETHAYILYPPKPAYAKLWSNSPESESPSEPPIKSRELDLVSHLHPPSQPPAHQQPHGRAPSHIQSTLRSRRRSTSQISSTGLHSKSYILPSDHTDGSVILAFANIPAIYINSACQYYCTTRLNTNETCDMPWRVPNANSTASIGRLTRSKTENCKKARLIVRFIKCMPVKRML